MEKVKILNVDILSVTTNDLLEQMESGILITPNVDHIVQLQKDKEFYELYNQAEWVTCDSKILAIAARLIGVTIKAVIPGSSFFPLFCEYHRNNPNVKIFLLGAAVGVAHEAQKRINNRVGRNIIVEAYSPSFGFENDEEECEQIVKIINQSKATVLVVGVGAPKQEKWIFKHKYKFENIKLFMALGATIDFEAGHKKRAPRIVQQIGMEWLYRLASEPKRLWKRYLIDDLPFFYYLVKQMLGKYKNPFLE